MPSSPSRAALVSRLRGTIEAIEKRPPLPRTRATPASAPFARLAEDALHEIWVPGFADAGLGLAFALGHAASRLDAARPAVLWIQRGPEALETGLPYAPGLAAFGLGPRDFVLIRTRTVAELLWAAEEAAGCPAVAGVIADVLSTPRALDFTASRRLALRAGESGVPVFLLRYGPEREASAARTRWRLTPAPSAAHPHDAYAPGAAQWEATLEKAPPGEMTSARTGPWRLAWTGTHFTLASPPLPQRPALHVPFGPTPQPTPDPIPADRATAPGAQPAALGHRLSETG